MDPRFLRFYEDELAHIRQTAGEFARQFPKIGGRLALDPDGRATCPDPFVERLLEGFAFLTARVQLKLAAEFPTFTQALLDTVYPQFLCPLPSATIVRFEPEVSEGSLAGGYRLDRGTVLRSHPAGTTGTACEYRTAHDVTLWPLQVRDVRYHSPRELGALELPAGLPAKAAIAV
jgi:type VI secretion system protein ImpG